MATVTTIERNGTGVYPIDDPNTRRKAGPEDLIVLHAYRDATPIYVKRIVMETVVDAIVAGEPIHLSGPTGTAKTSLIDAIRKVPKNFDTVCRWLNLEKKPLRISIIEMPAIETPSELYHFLGLRKGSTRHEPSKLVLAVKAAAKHAESHYNLIWLRELGRVMNRMVQGSLLNFVTDEDIVLLDDDDPVWGRPICWIADSNYQAQEHNHNLVNFDDALRRRFTHNITMAYLSFEQETRLMRHLYATRELWTRGKRTPRSNRDLNDVIEKVVTLGNLIRERKAEGELSSVAPPTIHNYKAFVNRAMRNNHHSLETIARDTLLGHTCNDEEEQVAAVVGSVFGLKADKHEEATLGGNVI